MSYLKEDLKRYMAPDKSIVSKMKIMMLTQGIWVTIIYRAGSWCHNNKERLVWPKFVLPFLTFIQLFIETATGISIPFTAKIGKGLYIGHFGGIILSPQSILGEYCNISQGVTIGQAGRGKQKTPVIGNRVFIAPGAKIFGGITIGNDVAIGANAVVTKDLPDMAVAVGIPAEILNYKGSKDFIVFRSQ